MYTSANSSSPVRTSTSEARLTNYRTQSYHSSDSIDTMNENSRRAYTNSASSINANPMNYNSSSPNQTRYQSTSYRSSGNDHENYRSNNRAYSYDDLLNEQKSMYNSRNNQFSRQQQQQPPPPSIRRDQYNSDDEDLIVKSTDLPANYEEEMIQLVRTAFRKYEITNQRELAGYLKRSADKIFTPCWHCIVGRQFSSYVTHEMNGFIYFTKGPLSILLFKSGA